VREAKRRSEAFQLWVVFAPERPAEMLKPSLIPFVLPPASHTGGSSSVNRPTFRSLNRPPGRCLDRSRTAIATELARTVAVPRRAIRRPDEPLPKTSVSRSTGSSKAPQATLPRVDGTGVAAATSLRMRPYSTCKCLARKPSIC
jgi:hypothetical protein